jgi:hypothetical protein
VEALAKRRRPTEARAGPSQAGSRGTWPTQLGTA